jgi:hypothetical protein
MSQRTATRLAWGLGLAGLVFTVIGLVFLLPDYSFPHVNDLPNMFNDAANIGFSLVVAGLGLFLALQRPQNRVCWLLLVVGTSNALSAASSEYSIYTMLVKPGALVGGVWVTWLQQWIWVPYVLAFGLILLYFPNGELLSRGWRWLVYALWTVSAVNLLSSALLTPMLVNGEPNQPVGNPLSGFFTPLQGFFKFASDVSLSVYLILFVPALVSLVIRFRKANGAEREQIKWFAYAAVFFFVAIVAGNGMSLFGSWSQGVVNIAGGAVPIAIVIAVLRYRLYDIDILIRRTLVYGALTALLVLVYFGSIVVLQEIFRRVTGQSSDLAIIISTLAIAALFNPLRHRVQDAIDHRFYRRKYDAQQVLARFARIARDEVVLEKLSDELLSVVNDTMQPASVSLWLKPGTTKKGQ